MAAPPKMSARDAFDLNIQDAQMLVELASLLSNQRTRRMRRELRDRIGEALSIPQKRRGELECLESDKVFVTFMPGHADWRDRLNDVGLRPLLRQALVAGCAAVETFCADRVMERYSAAIKQSPPPSRLLELSLTVDQYLTIQQTYQKTGWGLRQVIELEVRQRASPAPSQIGQLFALVGEKALLARVDQRRKVPKGDTDGQLSRIVARRNLIAHTGDRSGRGRAVITTTEVKADVATLISIIDALDEETKPTR
jgi:RiboL-PSP-HEPN